MNEHTVYVTLKSKCFNLTSINVKFNITNLKEFKDKNNIHITLIGRPIFVFDKFLGFKINLDQFHNAGIFFLTRKYCSPRWPHFMALLTTELFDMKMASNARRVSVT